MPLVNILNSILKHDLQKVDLLIESLTTTECIRKSILEYFDEQNLKDNCEMCSNCVGEKLASNIKVEVDKNYATDEEIRETRHFPVDVVEDAVPLTLLKCITQEQDILEKDVVKILVGDLHRLSSRWKFQLNCYGLLGNFKDKSIVLDKSLEGLINNKLISKEIDGSLRITKKGMQYVLENTKPSKSSYHKKLEKIKEKYPNAYENWTPEADEKIKKFHYEGKSTSELSEIFQRKPGAIRSRLKKLGLLK